MPTAERKGFLPKQVKIAYASSLLGVVAGLLNSVWVVGEVAANVSKEELGLYVFVAAVINYFALSQLGLDSATSQRISESLSLNKLDQATRVYRQLWGFNGAIGLIAIAITFTAVVFLSYFIDLHHQRLTIQLVALSGVGLAIRFFANPSRTAINGAQKVHLIGFLNLATSMLNVLLTISLLKLGYGILCLPLAHLITNTTSFFCLHFLRRHHCKWTMQPVEEVWRGFGSLVRFSIGISICMALSMLQGSCEPLLFQLLTTEPLDRAAEYHMWLRFPSMAFVLSSSFVNHSGPALATQITKNRESGTQLFQTLFRVSSVLGIASAIALTIWLTPVIRLWLGSKYEVESSAELATALAALVFARSVFFPCVSLLYPLQRVSDAIKTYGVLAIAKIALGFVLIPYFSITGMAIGYASSTLLATLTAAYLIGKQGITFPIVLTITIGGVLISVASRIAPFTSTMNFQQTAIGIGITSIVLGAFVGLTLFFPRSQRSTATSTPTST